MHQPPTQRQLVTPQTVRILTECDTLLAEIGRNYTVAVRQLEQAAPGFPAHTPAAGEPGTSKSFTGGSIVERLALHPHPELDAAQRLHHEPHTIMAATIAVTETLRLPHPNLDLSQHKALQALLWSRWAIRRTLQTTTNPATRPLNDLHNTIIDLHRTVTTWAYTAAVPATTATNQLADDPTERWCRNCLNIGVREPRWRGDLCRWCYEFNASERFLPPPALLKIRQSKSRVTQRDVEPFIRAHNERNKKRRRKAG